MTERRSPAQVLLEARQKDSRQKRASVFAAVDRMKADGDPISFSAVAKAAGVSNWLVYSEGVREYIEAARKGQAGVASRQQREGKGPSPASLATDLELARAELRTVRGERDRLKAAVQRSLGRQVDQVGSAQLVARVQELIRQVEERDRKLAAVRVERDDLQRSLDEAQDDLISVRTALQKMVREQSRRPG